MEKCELCDNMSDKTIEGHNYCAKHYVETEGEECVYWQFVWPDLKKDLSNVDKLEGSLKRIYEEVKKQFPGLLERRKNEVED